MASTARSTSEASCGHRAARRPGQRQRQHRRGRPRRGWRSVARRRAARRRAVAVAVAAAAASRRQLAPPTSGHRGPGRHRRRVRPPREDPPGAGRSGTRSTTSMGPRRSGRALDERRPVAGHDHEVLVLLLEEAGGERSSSSRSGPEASGSPSAASAGRRAAPADRPGPSRCLPPRPAPAGLPRG